MIIIPTPLQYLAATALAFAVGALLALAAPRFCHNTSRQPADDQPSQ